MLTDEHRGQLAQFTSGELIDYLRRKVQQNSRNMRGVFPDKDNEQHLRVRHYAWQMEAHINALDTAHRQFEDAHKEASK